MEDSRWTAAFGSTPLVVIGMVHLDALPGSPDWGGDLEAVVEHALEDLRMLEDLGCDAVMIENLRDAPFFRDEVGAETVAAMAAVGREVTREAHVPVGYQVLRNAARASVALAAVVGGSFVRINVYTDAMITDQGLIQGVAADVVRYRRQLGSDIMLFADLYSKHAAPLAPRPIDVVAQDSLHRGKASGLILSGVDSVTPPTEADILRVREAVPGGKLILGSGTPARMTPDILRHIDGAIIPSPRTYDTPMWSGTAGDDTRAYDAAQAWMDAARGAHAQLA